MPSFSVSKITGPELGASWRPGCPVGPDELRRVRVAYWGFDGFEHAGALIVNADAVDATLTVFRRLHDARFPIRRIVPVDAYGADDRTSMAADNTSAFNCRPVAGSNPPRWSEHAYGHAIDVNTIENPYVQGSSVSPPAGAGYTDRTTVRPGMAYAGGTVVDAFAAVGWQWGGRWSSPDYQHFSSTGG